MSRARVGDRDRRFPDLEARLEVKIARRTQELSLSLESEVRWLEEGVEALAKELAGARGKREEAEVTSGGVGKCDALLESSEEILLILEDLCRRARLALMKMPSQTSSDGEGDKSDAEETKRFFTLTEETKRRAREGAACYFVAHLQTRN